METIHYHAPGTPRPWACGFQLGHATGVPAQVTCEDCLPLLPKEPKRGNPEILSVQPPDVHGQGDGEILGDVPEVSAVQP